MIEVLRDVRGWLYQVVCTHDDSVPVTREWVNQYRRSQVTGQLFYRGRWEATRECLECGYVWYVTDRWSVWDESERDTSDPDTPNPELYKGY